MDFQCFLEGISVNLRRCDLGEIVLDADVVMSGLQGKHDPFILLVKEVTECSYRVTYLLRLIKSVHQTWILDIIYAKIVKEFIILIIPDNMDLNVTKRDKNKYFKKVDK